MLRLSYFAVGVGVVVVLGSCGLVDTSVADLKLSFPRRDFQIDTDDWHLNGEETLPEVSCTVGCESASSTLCTDGECRSDCETTTQKCQAHVPIVLRNDFDLATQVPEYQQIADQPIISVSIDGIFFDITENTLTIDTPTLSVYMGPSSATAPTEAELVGTIESVPHEMPGRRAVRFEGGGKQILKRYMDDFHTPFRVLVSGEVTVVSGGKLPKGKLVGSVQADAHVGLN